ncbi:transketolase [Candidatus Peregrinibacteria bacterium CG10_big_fil_rev_8_21_14_0_10_49_10]|nr:MAG: transketolase [Candidatus Peregrinibacteria bacterium CG10_big_fil_rev_8_21_14_0_10_49_10]
MGILLKQELADLEKKSRQIRASAVEMVCNSHSAHLGSALSMVDLLTVLYFWYLKVDPKNPKDSERDRFVLSKGHGGSGLYATLAEKGFFPKKELETYGKDGSLFAVHPSSKMVPGVEASTGSLGHGLPIGLGMALAAKLDGKPYRTVVITSDGECDEGSTWEAILAAGHWKLDNLICIVDYNKIQSFGRTEEVMDLEPFAEKFRSFNWSVCEINGHNHEEIAEALHKAPLEKGKPTAIIAHTVKGKGWSAEMENTVESHYTPPNQNDVDRLKSCLS